MQKRIGIKTITKNATTSIMVQAISLCVSIILNFAIPKCISEHQYAYWQTFLLYLGYVGVLHFGLLDGIVLRYSQYNFEELDRKTFRSMFLMLLLMTSSIALLFCVIAVLFATGITRTTIILVALGVISKNIFSYNYYLFQITNRINQYAKLIITQRVTCGLLVVGMLVLRVDDFKWYCLAELVGDSVGSALAFFYNRGMYLGKKLTRRSTLIEFKVNISSGIMLMLANWSSMLLLGGSKMIIQWHWDELVFGKIAFSFSVSNLFLTFVTAISVVLFPALKRMKQDMLPTFYKGIRNLLSPILLFALVCYYPGCWLIEKLLPRYSESLPYLGVLLPMIVYTSKVNLLTNNYLKAYRKEKQMLALNALSITVAFILYVVSAYIFDNLIAVLTCVVVATMFNSILSELIVMRIIRIKIIKEIVAELLMTVVFIGTALNMEPLLACITYVCTLMIYLFVFRKNIQNIRHITN